MPIIAPLLILVAAPPVIFAPPPPPVIQHISSSVDAQTSFLVDVEVRHGRNLLWRGSLSLASSGNASFFQRQQESFACSPADRRLGRRSIQRSTGLSLSLNGRYQADGPVNVNIEWTRPMTERIPAEGSCDDREAGTLTARLESSVELALGKPVTLNGDGGLSITLTRR